MSRLFPALLCAAVLVPCAAASASAGTEYFVTTTGSGSDCTQAAPCATIADALAAHRVAPAAGDIITVGAGTFVENVVADDPADDGLTIRGTLSGSTRQTTIRAAGTGATGCMADPCGVILGTLGAAVTLRDVNVDTVGAADGITPVSVEGGSDLVNLHVTSHPGDDVGQMVILCDDVGTTIERTTIDAASADSDASGIDTLEGFKLADSHVIVDSGIAVIQSGFGAATRPITLKRSWLEASPGGSNALLVSLGDLIVDSSLLTGNLFGAVFQGSDGATWTIYNSTIDVATAGANDSGGPDLFIISVDGNPNPTIDVNSSILVDEIDWFQPSGFEGGGTMTCEYDDIGTLNDPVAPADGSGCGFGPPSGLTNTQSDPNDMFVGGSPYSWELKADAPVRDAGDPTSSSSYSPRDLLGNARERVGLSAGCGAPAIRDKGAYEETATCAPLVVSAPLIKRATAPTAGTKLGSSPGRWTDSPTSYAFQWIRCDADGTSNCVDLSGKTGSTYTPAGADDGHTLKVRVIATNTGGSSNPSTSGPSGVVTFTGVPVLATAPSIKNGTTPSATTKLGAQPGRWTNSPTSYSFQWISCDADGTSNCVDLSGKNGSTFTPGAGLVGKTVRLRVTATNGAGSSSPSTTAATGVIS